MTKHEALEDALFTIKKFNDYLNETNPKHPINIIDSGYTDPTLVSLSNDCDVALFHIDKQIETELEKENEQLSSEGIRTGYLVGE